MNNLAFIDGQNLYMGTNMPPDKWSVDLKRFRIYLDRKYKVVKAYYFLGFIQESNRELYKEIQEAGFILIFRQHTELMIGNKKGNVDTDIVFHIMKMMYLKEGFDKIILVSGDGDYKSLVDFMIKEERFEKIMFPSMKFSSSLYKELSNEYFVNLDTKSIREKIQVK
jgi:uncharacterized LabA/DUF88 family protein